jgi:hypothetical protein
VSGRRLALLLATTLCACLCSPGASDATISFVATSSADTGTGASTLTLAPPTGIAAGDVLVATLAIAGTGTVTAPSGWTAVQNITSGTAMRHATWYRVATTSEPASYQWGLSASRTAAAGAIGAYRGVNGTVPIDASATSTGASGNATTPAVTTTSVGDLAIAATGFATATTVTPDASTTERYDRSSSAGATAEGADFTQASAGATAAKTAAPAVSSSRWASATIALRDAAQATLQASTTAAPSFSANLDSGDQTSTYTLPITVLDTRTGTGAGWNLTITSTSFSTGTATLATDASNITAVTSSCANGGICTAATNTVSYPVAVPAGASAPSAVKFYNAAAATGRGAFTITPTIAVTVPQNSYHGTYTSTLTISVVSGP